MFSGGLRPYTLPPLNRGCVNNLALIVVRKQNCESPEVPVDKTDKKIYLTVKTQPWDTDADDSDAVFKVQGSFPNPDTEPGRVVFTLSETNTYQDPTVVPYYFDIVSTDQDGTSNAKTVAYGTFVIVGHPNNAQAGGEA